MTQPIGPHYQITFDPEYVIGSLTVRAPATDDDLADAIVKHISDTFDYDDTDELTAHINADGTMRVHDAQDGEDYTGTISLVSPPDYWTQLAAELHTVADKLATLAGTPAPNGTTFLSMCASHAATQANWSRPIIDAFASAIGANPAQVKKIAGGWDYLAEMQLPSLRVQAYAAIPDPTETDKDARIRELEAQLAAKTEQAMSGGAR